MTVSTFFPDADPETTSVDGETSTGALAEDTWAVFRDYTLGSAGPSGATMSTRITRGTVSPKWETFERIIAVFATGDTIPDGDTVNSATFEFVSTSKAETIASQSIAMVTSTPASNTNLVSGDFAQLGTVHQAGDRLLADIVSDSATYNVFTLNATGLGNVKKLAGEVSKFGVRIVSDADNAEPLPWATAGSSARVTMASADTALGADKRPKLVVTHTAPPTTFVPKMLAF